MAVASSGRPVGSAGPGRLNGEPALRAPRNLNLANCLTLLRLLAVVPTVLLVQAHAFEFAFWLFFAAGVTDALDGFVAKHLTGTSRLGSIMDPAADKLLLISMFFVLAWQGLTPAWLLALAIGRDLLLLVGTLILRFRVAGFEVQPSLWGKACTLAQILYVGAVLAGAARLLSFAPMLSALLLPLLAALTLLSALTYTIGAIRMGAAGAVRG